LASVTWVRWGSLTSDGGLQQLQPALLSVTFVCLASTLTMDTHLFIVF